MSDEHDEPTDSSRPAGESAGTPPHLDESVRRLRASGQATLGSAIDTGRALRKLVFADLALSRSALGRALAWFAVAIIFGASAWLLFMGAVIALLQGVFGLSWLLSISIATLVSLAVTALAGWRVSVFFEYAGMHATRRQLARIGIGDESGDDAHHEDDDEPTSARGAAT